MPESNQIEVRIGANVEGLRNGVREATGHVDSLRGTLLEMKAHATQTGRAARFFANDIASMVPVSTEAKGAIQGLFEVMLSGGAIGIAIHGVKLLVEVFHLLAHEGDQSREAVKKYAEESDKSLASIKAKVDSLLLSFKNLTEAQKLAATDLAVAEGQVVKAQADQLAAALRLESARTNAKEAVEIIGKKGAEAEKLISAATKKAGEDYLAAILNLQKAQDLVRDIKEGIGKVAKGEADRDAAKAREDEQKQREKDLDEQVKSYQAMLNKESKAEFDAGQAMDKYRERRQQYQIDLDKRRSDQDDRAREEKKKKDDKEAAEQKKRAEQVAGVLTHAFSSAFHSILSGQRDVGEAVLGMLQGIAEAAIDAMFKIVAESIVTAIMGTAVDSARAVTEVIHNAAVGGAAAAAATAAIPIIGPGLAIEAGFAMEGAILAAFGPQAAARGGFDVPRGVNPITQLHEEEMVLPAHIANPLREQLAGGGGMGGDTYQITIHAMDGDSVRRVVNSDAFVRAIIDARQRGRLT